MSGLQDQRALLRRVSRIGEEGIQAIASGERPGMGATATAPGTSASTSTAKEDDQAIYNRSPTINHNYYQDAGREQSEPSRQTSGIPYWVAVLLIAGVLGLVAAWWAYTHWPQPAPIESTAKPDKPAKPPVAAQTQELLEIKVTPRPL